MCCHAVVASGGSLSELIAVFGVALVAGVAAFMWLRSGSMQPPASAAAPAAALRRPWLQIGGFAAGAIGAATFTARGDALAAWWWVVSVLALAAIPTVILTGPRWESPAEGRGREATLWGIAIIAVVFTAVVHRPDIDDAFYVNLAVAAVDAPGAALLSGDTLHGVAGLPLHLPVYRAHSYELWNALFSSVSGIPVIESFHWVSASMAALLVPLAAAYLFRLLTPRHWLEATLTLVLVLTAVGETHRSYGNFAFVRMWQGKALALFVFVPLVYVYALRFARRPDPGNWLFLCAAQIAALGCSASALWMAPASALAGLCCVLRPTRDGVKTLALGGLASGYVLASAWLLRDNMASFAPAQLISFPGAELEAAAREVLGSGRVALFFVAALAVAWACRGTELAARFAIVVPLAVLVVVLNPYTSDWFRGNVTGPSYWRGFWALPLPALVTLVLTTPLRLGSGVGPTSLRPVGVAGWVAACAVFAFAVPTYSTISRRNVGADVGIRIGWPSLKVPEEPYRWAQALGAAAGPGGIVAAPYWISRWVPTFHGGAHPLEVRLAYLMPLRESLGERNVEDRHLISAYTDGAVLAPDAEERFRAGLDAYDVAAVYLTLSNTSGRAREILRERGFQRTLSGAGCEIWARPRRTATP